MRKWWRERRMKIKTGMYRNRRVYEYTGYTYGVVTPGGIAVTDEAGFLPFEEINKDDIQWDGFVEIEFPWKFKGDKNDN